MRSRFTIDTNPSSLERDLTNFMVDKLRTVVKDTAMRCQVMELSDQQTMAIIMSGFTSEFVRFLNNMEVTPADAGRMIFDMYSMAIEKGVVNAPQK